MSEKPQQQTLSVRIDDALRRRLERARQLSASKTGEPVSTSEIAKQFLESARDDRLEVVDLLADATESLGQIRRKGEASMVLSRAEWTALAHFVRHGLEASPAQAPNAVSQASLIAVLDAFLAVYDLRAEASTRLDAFYLGNLPPECRPVTSKRAGRVAPSTPDVVRRAIRKTHRRVRDLSATQLPTLAGRNLYVLLEEDKVPGAEDLTRALRPFWPMLWRLAARGHYVLMKAPVRNSATARDGVYQPPIPSLTEGSHSLSFARGGGGDLSALLTLPGPRGTIYPIVGYPRLVEFRAMLAALAADSRPGDWTGAYFFADVIAPDPTHASDLWFRAHDNGITFGFSVAEWRAIDRLFGRAWELPEMRRVWDVLTIEYGEL